MVADDAKELQLWRKTMSHNRPFLQEDPTILQGWFERCVYAFGQMVGILLTLFTLGAIFVLLAAFMG